MRVRTGTPNDFPGIRDVANRSLAASYDDVLDADARQRVVESWYGTEQSAPSVLREEMADGRTVVLVAESDRGIAGFAQAFLSEGVGCIEWIHVRPNRRDEGVGDDLRARIEEALAERGADRIEARVIEANDEGRAFYEERGYERETTRQIRIGEERVSELTLVADAESAAVADEQAESVEVGEERSVEIATDEPEHGTKGPFHPTYFDASREERLGWHCGACDSLDVNMGTMGEIVCDDCGNQRRPRRWDAAYGG
ncbi:GNAT family N-acetyltransferase [Halolamina salifodinae]|uniref:GNAT superfamily N-acetyltransferase n=1 Tax=Halolamina salifodinae TaxID=1202767 RepID=A0A8T4GY34_9EURY|nr:GNAT family N-acetyltransferase [Halolamina salifodinae]MBP1987033.1 GNAT superfamily N-acetyltransferase [Halolamina salifodinae]